MRQGLRARITTTADVGWALPLRLFLGFAFTYAGLSKIADRDFLDDAAATSMHQTLAAVRDSSPIGGLLGPIESHSALFGATIAIGEVAVGLGLLVGLLTRIAALGGMTLSLGLWLTVSWNADPWYTGADIVYLFALTPLALAGAGAISADAWLADIAARERIRPDGQPGVDGTRRALLAGGLGFTGLLALGGAFLARGANPDAAVRAAPSSPSSPPTNSTPAATGPRIVAVSKVPIGGATKAKDPQTDDETWVMQLQSGQFTAVRAACPHQGCDVNFVSSADGFLCPCHHSRFSSTGKRLSGPATRDLAAVDVAVGDGEVRLA